MKRLLILLGVISLCFVIETAYGLPWPPEIDIVEISFNYESGYSYDALTLKTNNSTYVPVPEWIAGTRNENIAYIQSQTNRKIKAKFWMDRAGNYNVGVYGVKIGSGTGIGDVSENTVVFSGSQYSTPKIMSCNGTVPGSVGKRYFSWRWYATYINAEEFENPLLIGDSGSHYYYTLLDAPQSPMTEPWTSVLDYACVWASGTTSESSALTEITNGAYNDFGSTHSYNGSQTHAQGTTLHLTSFLADNDADCRDMSAVVHVFTRAIGGSSTYARIIWGQFYTKSIDPIGNGSDWQSMLWNFHQVAWSNVYDATLRLNPNNPRIPVNEDINGSYKNDLFYSGYWNPDTPFSYTTVD